MKTLIIAFVLTFTLAGCTPAMMVKPGQMTDKDRDIVACTNQEEGLPGTAKRAFIHAMLPNTDVVIKKCMQNKGYIVQR
jgi:hypothetical protein